MMGNWQRVVLDVSEPGELAALRGSSLLKDLVDGAVPVVVLRGLLPAEVVTRNRERAASLFHTATTTQYANGSLTTVGPYLAKYLAAPATYFREAADAQGLLQRTGFDLTVRTRSALAEFFELRSFSPAVEPDGRRYAEQNVRIYPVGNETPLHNDNIMRDAAGTGLMLANLTCHLSCVVCLQECAEGGELQVHKKMWEPVDEAYKSAGRLGYYESVAMGASCHKFKPRTGDIYLLNPTHYHSIAQVGGCDRITMGFFFGFFDHSLNDAVSWV